MDEPPRLRTGGILALGLLCLAGLISGAVLVVLRRAPAPLLRPAVHRRMFEAAFAGFDPAKTGDGWSASAALQVYEPPYAYHYLKRPLELVPLTAAGMPEVSADGLTHTVRLKAGLWFHDDPCFPGGVGREVTAEDYLHSWRRVADPAVQSELWAMAQGLVVGLDAWREAAQAAGRADYARPVEGLSAPDSRTMVFRLTQPTPKFRHLLAMPFAAAVPREAVERYGDDFQNRALGTGAFRLAEWVPNSRFLLERNPRYHEVLYPSEGEPGDAEAGLLADAGRPLPLSDRVEVDIVVEDQPRWLRFLEGAGDLLQLRKDSFESAARGGTLTPDLVARGVRAHVVALPDVHYIGLNMRDPLLGGNGKLRRAIACAVDTVKHRQILQNNRGLLPQSPIPPGFFGHDPHWANPWQRYDPDLARKLLAEAGYPEGQGLPELVFETASPSAGQRQGAELLQEMLRRVGIRMRIEVNTWPLFTEKINQNRAQIFSVGWGADYPDPENFLQLLYGPNAAPAGQNGTAFRNEEFDRLYEEILRLQDGPERYRRIRRMVEIACEANVWVFLLHTEDWIVTQPWLRNFKRPLVGEGFWKYLRPDPDARARVVGG